MKAARWCLHCNYLASWMQGCHVQLSPAGQAVQTAPLFTCECALAFQWRTATPLGNDRCKASGFPKLVEVAYVHKYKGMRYVFPRGPFAVGSCRNHAWLSQEVSYFMLF